MSTWTPNTYSSFNTTYKASHLGRTAPRVPSKKKIDTFTHSAPFQGESTKQRDFKAFSPAEAAKGRGKPVQTRAHDSRGFHNAKFTATSTYSHEIRPHLGNHRAHDTQHKGRQFKQWPDTRDWQTDYRQSFHTHDKAHVAKARSCKPDREKASAATNVPFLATSTSRVAFLAHPEHRPKRAVRKDQVYRKIKENRDFQSDNRLHFRDPKQLLGEIRSR